jgi:hypothetical protein
MFGAGMIETNQQTFSTTIQKEGSFIFVAIPFSPKEVWGTKPRYHVTGTINGYKVRGCLGVQNQAYFLRLGSAWIKDNAIRVGEKVRVNLTLEGPQESNVAVDIAKALSRNKKARAFFEGLPTFYRKNYIRWIESAKKEETRSRRIEEMMKLLSEEKRER